MNSPPNPFVLPIYARSGAKDFIRAPSLTPGCRRFCEDQRVLEFLDDAANCDKNVDCK